MRPDRDTPPDHEGDPRHRGRDRVRSLREHTLRVSRTFPAAASSRSGRARWTSVAVIAVAAVSTSVGCSESRPQTAPASTRTPTTKADTVRTSPPPDARAGARVFETTCKKCHTVEVRGWIDDRVSLRALRPSYSTTVDKVTNGGAAMPAFRGKLSEQDIVNVAAFVSRVASRRRAHARPKTAFDYLRSWRRLNRQELAQRARAARRAEGG
jgi:mono/diheme cytochrome c family protein